MLALRDKNQVLPSLLRQRLHQSPPVPPPHFQPKALSSTRRHSETQCRHSHAARARHNPDFWTVVETFRDEDPEATWCLALGSVEEAGILEDLVVEVEVGGGWHRCVGILRRGSLVAVGMV